MVRRRPVFSAVLGTVAGILILASGCAEQDPTAVQLKPARALSAARAYQRGTYAMNIGPSGGSINFPIGQIVFPAGAVTEETTITILHPFTPSAIVDGIEASPYQPAFRRLDLNLAAIIHQLPQADESASK